MLRNLKIQPKFFLYFSGLVFITLILVISTIYYFQRQMIFKLAEEKALSLTSTLAHTSFNAILFDDYLVLQSIVDGMSDSPDIVSITIIDTIGKIIVSNISEKKGTQLKDELTKKALMSETYLIQSVPTDEGNEIWDTAVPIYELNKRLATARIKYSVEDTYRGLLLTISAIGITVLLLSIFLSYKFSKSISNPIKNAVKLAHEYGRGNLDANIPLIQEDEIGQLIRSLNKLSGELKSMIEEKVSNENLVMMGEFASFIIHDLKNPISGIHLLAEGLDSKMTEHQSLKKYTTEILIASKKLEHFVIKTLDISRSTSPNLQLIKLHELINSVLSEINLNSISIEKKYDPTIKEIKADYQLLFRAIKNILINAVESIPNEGKIIVETLWKEEIFITISDNGIGIAESRLNSIFRPFYSNKKQGHGLGLAMAKKAIIMHRGTIEAMSKEGSGSTFKIILPDISKYNSNQFKSK